MYKTEKKVVDLSEIGMLLKENADTIYRVVVEPVYGRTAQEMLDATGRKVFGRADRVKSMPVTGGKKVEIFFEYSAKGIDKDKENKKRECREVMPFELAAVVGLFPDLDHDHALGISTEWPTESGKEWNFISFTQGTVIVSFSGVYPKVGWSCFARDCE